MDKFSKFYELQKFLSSVPVLVREAWQNGWSEIKHHPKGYEDEYSCRCCSTKHAPGWYGIPPKRTFKEIICGLKGERLENSIIGGDAIDNDHY